MKRIFIVLLVMFCGLLFGDFKDDSTPTQNDIIQIAENYSFIINGPGAFSIDRIVPFYTDKIIFFIVYYNPTGYVVIPNNKKIHPIKAWSFENSCSSVSGENHIVDILAKDISTAINYYTNKKEKVNSENEILWDYYLGNDSGYKRELDEFQYGPWLMSNWSQDSPFNNNCPMDPNTRERCVAGCVPIALAQICNYWEYPYKITSSMVHDYSSRETRPHIVIEADDALMDTIIYSPSNQLCPSTETLAQFCFACGVAVEAQYSSDGTGAFMSHDKWRNFGYSDVDDIGDEFRWVTIQDNIMKGYPIYQSFAGMEVGHAVVVDGFRTGGQYHVNMGWGGSENGWYTPADELPADLIGWSTTWANIYPPDHTDFGNVPESALELVPVNEPTKVVNMIDNESDIEYYKFWGHSDSIYSIMVTAPVNMNLQILTESYEDPIFEITDGGPYIFGSFHYFLPPIDGYNEYFIRLTSTEDYFPHTIHKLIFNVSERPNFEIIQPTYPDTFFYGDTVRIISTRSGFIPPYPLLPVNTFEYCTDGTSGPWHSIADSIPETTYYWIVPSLPGTLYDNFYVRVKDTHTNIGATITEPIVVRARSNVVENQKPVELFLKTYPNPFNSTLNVSYSTESPPFLEICNVQGTTVYSQNLQSTYGNVLVDLALESGIYYVILSSKNSIVSKPVLLIK